METEQQIYEVPGQQWRWRAAQLNAQGLPFEATYNRAAGVYLVVVNQPVGADPFACQPRRPYPVFERQWLLRWGLVLAVAAALLGVGYLVVRQAGDVDLDAIWQRVEAIRWPWEPSLPQGEPIVETTEFRWPWESKVISAPRSQGGGFQWPWDSAVRSAQDTVTMAAGAILAVLVLLIVLSLVRKRR